jgi:hypothetical protein
MGLFKRLTGNESKLAPQNASTAKDTRWLEDVERFGDIRIDVVGESHYQPAIRSVCD